MLVPPLGKVKVLHRPVAPDDLAAVILEIEIANPAYRVQCYAGIREIESYYERGNVKMKP